jgi:hypothetical protein
MAKNILTRGNSKLDKSILCFAIAPVVSCLNCSQCKKSCYALKPYRRWTDVKNAWNRNFSMAKDGTFIPVVTRQIKASRTCKTVRIHVAGDFFSAEYIEQWSAIVDLFPHINFYSYTKVWHLFPTQLAILNSKPNCNIINSIADDGGVNFGDTNRVSQLKAMGYNVCPVEKTNKVICGKDCKICVTENKVAFKIH